MGRKKDLTQAQINACEVLLKEEIFTNREIAMKVKISAATSVQKIRSNLQQQIPTTSQRQGRSGRKKVTTQRQMMLLVLRKQPLSTAVAVRNTVRDLGVNVSLRTTQRRLQQLGCTSVIPKKVPVLTQAMHRKRLAFAKNHQHWTAEDWRNVAFSDESSFQCQTASAQNVWRLPH